MRRVFLYGSFFFCMFIAPAAVTHAAGEDGDGAGLLIGVMEKVESAVEETTESVGDFVGSAVEATDQTVQDAVSFKKDMVGTLTAPSTEQPVSKIVNRTVDFVDETVGNVVPIVENTTGTVQTATSAVTGIVEELPEVPVATPVLKEVSKVVTGTTETVSEAVESINVKEAVASFEKAAGNETPVLSRRDDTSSKGTQSNEVIEQPVIDREILKFNEPTADEDPTFIPSGASQEAAVSTVKKGAKGATVKEEMPAKHEVPAIPIQSSTQWEGIPIAVTTGTTSVVSPIVTHGGNADVLPGIVDWLAELNSLSSRQWVHSDEQMRVQWVHAPPGQPPQSTPFLQAKK